MKYKYQVLCMLDLNIESSMIQVAAIENSLKRKIKDLFNNHQTEFKIQGITMKIKAG